MTKDEKEIYLKLKSIAFLIHCYQLGDKQYFFGLFPNFDQDLLDRIWQTEAIRIPIVKFYEQLSVAELEIVRDNFKKFLFNSLKLFEYLSQPINRNVDIKMEGTLRKLLAQRYIKSTEYSILGLSLTPDKFLSETFKRQRKLRQRVIIIGFAVVIAIAISLPRVIEGLTPVETLARKYHEKSKYKFSGSLCWDGWKSHSRGSGTCSHHGGIRSYFEKGDYSLTYQECVEIAKKRSWIK